MTRKVYGLLIECLGCGRMLPRGRFRVKRKATLKTPRRISSQCFDCERPGKAARAATRRARCPG